MSEETDVMALLQRMQQQLVYLERKIDTLLAAGAAGGSSQDRPFRKPFNKPFRPGGGGHDFKKKPFYGRPKG